MGVSWMAWRKHKYQVYYFKRKYAAKAVLGHSPSNMEELEHNYDLALEALVANDLEDVFSILNREEMTKVLCKNLSHQSMSVGDIAIDENGKIWFCCGIGWRELFKKEGPKPPDKTPIDFSRELGLKTPPKILMVD